MTVVVYYYVAYNLCVQYSHSYAYTYMYNVYNYFYSIISHVREFHHSNIRAKLE